MNTNFCVCLCTVMLLAFSLNSAAANKGDMAPDFSLPSLLSQETITLSDYRGKVVLLDFWSAWCAPCRESLPVLSALREELSRHHFELLSIDIDKQPAAARKFVRNLQHQHPIAQDSLAGVARRYGVTTLPSSFLINRQGIVEKVYRGFRVAESDQLKRDILQQISVL